MHQSKTRLRWLKLGTVVALALGASQAWAVEYPAFVLTANSVKGNKVELRSPDMKHQSLGLLGFRLGLVPSGDEHVGSFGFGPFDREWPTTSLVNEALFVGFTGHGDLNNPPPFNAKVRYVKLPIYKSNRRLAQSTNCGSVCSLDVGEPPERGDQLLLQGFGFVDLEHNARLKGITVRYQPSTNKVEARLIGVPKISAHIAFSWIPASVVERTGTATAGKRADTATQSLAASGALKIIQGFKVEWNNGGHNLRDFGIDATQSGFDVTFNDQNLDDPASLLVDYAVLKGTLPPVVVRAPSPR